MKRTRLYIRVGHFVPFDVHLSFVAQGFPGGQWLRFCTTTAGAWVPSSVGELRSHMLYSTAKKKYIYICLSRKENT